MKAVALFMEVMGGLLSLMAVLFIGPSSESADLVVLTAICSVPAALFLTTKAKVINSGLRPLALEDVYLFGVALLLNIGVAFSATWILEIEDRVNIGASAIIGVATTCQVINIVWVQLLVRGEALLISKGGALLIRCAGFIIAGIRNDLYEFILMMLIAACSEAFIGLAMSARAWLGTRGPGFQLGSLGISQCVARLDNALFKVMFAMIFGEQVARLAVAETVTGAGGALYEKYLVRSKVFARCLIAVEALIVLLGAVGAGFFIQSNDHGVAAAFSVLCVAGVSTLPMLRFYGALSRTGANAVARIAVGISLASLGLKAGTLTTGMLASGSADILLLLIYMFPPFAATVAYRSMARA